MERIVTGNAGLIRRVMPRGSLRWLIAAGLGLAIFTAAVPGGSPGFAWGQTLSNGIEEFRARRDLRDSQQAGRSDETVGHALAYLKKFPTGRFYDEMLLALANARGKQSKPRAALRAYKTLIEKFPDSPFRERALFDSLAPLVALGKNKDAYATVELLIEGFPDSVMRGQALLWKARALDAKGESAEVVRTLQRIRPDRDLPPGKEIEFLRLQVVHLTRSGEPAWSPLQKYLKTGDSDVRKAEVLMLVAETARKGGRGPEAFQYYRQVAEDYPVPPHLGEGLFWRAELFARHRLSGATKAQRAARLETAIGYYSAYLKFGGENYAVQALLGRAGLNRETERHKEALADYETAVGLNGALKEKKEITKARIQLHITLGQKNKASLLLGSLFKGKNLNPEERIAYRLELAGIFYEDRKCESVEQLLNPMPIIADQTLRPRATFIRGFCRFHLQQWKKASLDLEKLVNDPEYHGLVQKPLLSAYQKSQQYFRLANLTEELLAAKRMEPSAETFQTLVVAYGRLKDPAMLLATYRRLEKLDAKAVAGVPVQLKWAQAEQALGRKEEAGKRYQGLMAKLNQEPGSDPEEYLKVLRAMVAFNAENKNFEAAEAALETASRVLEDPPALSAVNAMKRRFFLQWGNQAIREGGPENAIGQLKEALAGIHPSERSARDPVALMLITGYLRSGKPGMALKTYRAELGPQAEAAKRADFTARTLKSAWETAGALKDTKKRPALIDFLAKVLVNLPPERSIDYYHSALVLDRLHQQQQDYPARIALMTSLRGIKLEAKILREVRHHQSRIHMEWGGALFKADQPDKARDQWNLALNLLQPAEWRLRYERVVQLRKIQEPGGNFTDLVLYSEEVLPDIKDRKTAKAVRLYLGRLYLNWAGKADEEKNLKSSKIRYFRAMDYLPESQWEERLEAAKGLSEVLQKLNDPAGAAQAIARVVTLLPDPKLAQQYSLSLGVFYREKVKDRKRARVWLAKADRGGNDDISLESAYWLADQEMTALREKAAIKRLNALVKRKIETSNWKVPIHYRLALLLHKNNALKLALRHYRIVAREKNPEMRKLYPEVIRQSRRKAREIAAFLKSGGTG